jgi:hypothetical protein
MEPQGSLPCSQQPAMLSVSLSSRHGESSVTGRADGLETYREAENIVNNHSRTADKEWSSISEVGAEG